MAREVIPHYENEDGEAHVPLEEEPDRDVAGQALADTTGVIYTFEARTKIRTQDCECVPTGDDCWDNRGHPCVVREAVDCWVFQGWDSPNALIELDIARDLADRPDTPIYRPAVPPFVAPGQVEAGL